MKYKKNSKVVIHVFCNFFSNVFSKEYMFFLATKLNKGYNRIGSNVLLTSYLPVT